VTVDESRVALLDINVLVALFDPEHVHHDAAHAWFGARRGGGWATCAITENGFVRVVSNPRYSGRRTTAADAADRLAELCDSEEHRFWPDSVSIRDRGLFRHRRLGGHRRVTDLWLLALAVRHGGLLATFDRGIPLAGVAGAGPGNLRLVGA
jgi:toxin-antitoxin system PIN domain toxin